MEETGMRGLVKAPQDMAAGVFLLALALFALWLGSSLNPGTMRSMGPGMLPRIVSVMMGATGIILVIGSLIWRGPPIDTIAFRGPFFITLGILVFGLTIRGFQIPLPGGGALSTPALGLLGAGPLAILVAGLASPETRWKDLAIFAICMTAFCLALFKGVAIPTSSGWTTYGLNLPIPLAPWLLGY
ncbi:MAG: hypothetical protein BGP06_16990 [Rhizobiales bacterium 65-9]|nr:tripartite tricarboxylate transporter TctB family protein [Hyphomicrobiales bacterium]OJY38130.1 MAG: hypothetical protein BGP06_16990 [Rhizobiales bacterium 65-9]